MSEPTAEQAQLEPLTFSVPEAGRLIGLSRNAAYHAAKRGELPTLKFGSRLVVPRAALLRLINGAT